MFLTVREVAERLKISPSCVYQLVESGKLAHHRIGTGRGAIRISEDDLNNFLSATRKEAEPPRFTPTRKKLKALKF
ncbi:MAG: helix-turn-helix domain-containing protein [Planctomycetaceae bacterium]|nr:helix-turn-helix domain-containing protein [Planctomycetaceae bacterium]MCA9078433.1 helix-turn-helix domain-containing protein [Planctomycetaceae bacterium]